MDTWKRKKTIELEIAGDVKIMISSISKQKKSMFLNKWKTKTIPLK